MPITHLYRYTTISKVERVLTHNELYFASPNSFNDPFDGRTPFNYSDCSKCDLDKFNAYTRLMLEHSLSSDKLKQEIVHGLIEKGKLIALVRNALHESLETTNEKVGILCLSETCEDILMWSHYADGHQGIVLEFDFTVLSSTAQKVNKVDYTDKYPTVADWLAALEQKIPMGDLFLFRKAEDWRYEKEWRCVINISDENRIRKYPKQMLTGIILGCRTSEGNRDRIKMWLDANKMNTKIYQAIKHDEKFALQIVSR